MQDACPTGIAIQPRRPMSLPHIITPRQEVTTGMTSEHHRRACRKDARQARMTENGKAWLANGDPPPPHPSGEKLMRPLLLNT